MSVKIHGITMYAGWKSKALSGVQGYIETIMQRNILEARDDAISTLKENQNVATKELSREDSFEIVKEKGTDLNISYSMRNITPYASYIERGTTPHFVPLKALIAYAMIKYRLPEHEAWPVAVGIQKSIQEAGTRPYPFMRPAFEKMRVQLKKELKQFSSDTGISGRPFTRIYGLGSGRRIER